MLTVLPIQTKDEQRELCEACNVEFIERAFAYKANDNGFIGICQFTFENNCGYIKNLSYAPKVDDTEAMIIMLRAAMSFMFRCGIDNCYMSKEGTTEKLLKLSGFRVNEAGEYFISLDWFYNTPCNKKD